MKGVFMNMFLNMKISQKLMFLVIISSMFLLTVGIVGLYFINEEAMNVKEMYHNNLLPISKLNLARNNANANRANMYNFIFTPDREEKEKMLADTNRRAKEIVATLNEFSDANSTPEELEHIDKANNYSKTVREYREKTIKLALNGNKEASYNQFQTSIKYLDGLQSELRYLATSKEKTANRIYEQSVNNTKNIMIGTIIFVLVSFGLTLYLGIYISRMISLRLQIIVDTIKEVADGNLALNDLKIVISDEIGDVGNALNKMKNDLKKLISNVNKSVEEITSNSEEMCAAADQTAQGAQQVAKSVEQLASGSQQIAINISQLASGATQVSNSVSQLAEGSETQFKSISTCLENISQINTNIKIISNGAKDTVELSRSTEENAQQGNIQADNAIKKINNLKTTSAETSKTINELGELSKNIEVIVDLIKGIAGQTNLLALNAAIEAARAGEHGKGFAVVADEVKKLAAQSSEATDKITAMIKEIQNKTNIAVITMDNGIKEVEDSVSLVDNVGIALEEILSAAKNTSNHITEISREVNTLASTSDNVLKIVENIAAVTQESSASAAEISSITQQTAASAEDVSSITEETAASAEEISSITEEQAASIEEINVSAQALSKVAENLSQLISVFKI